MNSFELQESLELNEHLEVVKVMLTTDNLRIVAGCGDGTVSVWNSIAGKFVLQSTFIAHSDAISTLSMESGDLLVTGGIDDPNNTIKLWSYYQAGNTY